MKKLISLLRLAHSIEIGAREAYKWHSMAAGKGTKDGLEIFLMSNEEEDHRKVVGKFLKMWGGKPNTLLDGAMWVIGNLVGLACFISPKRASALGARLMEAVGGDIYFDLADVSFDEGYKNTAFVFIKMATTERAHEEFFKQKYLS